MNFLFLEGFGHHLFHYVVNSVVGYGGLLVKMTDLPYHILHLFTVQMATLLTMSYVVEAFYW